MTRSQCMSCQCEIDNHSLLICEDCIGDNCNSFLEYIVKYDESIIDIENQASDDRNDFLVDILETGGPADYKLTSQDFRELAAVADPDPWMDEPWTEEEMACFKGLDNSDLWIPWEDSKKDSEEDNK